MPLLKASVHRDAISYNDSHILKYKSFLDTDVTLIHIDVTTLHN